jgi:opacity protein-like surface antigen
MRRFLASLAVLAAFTPVAAPPALADGKVELYLLRMAPSDGDSRQFSRPGWGLGMQGIAPMPGTATLLGLVAGVEVVNLLTSSTTFEDEYSSLSVVQETSQNYGRCFLGTRLGSQGTGSLRPYAGVNVAAVWYWITTDAVVPDDSGRQDEIRQHLGNRNEVAFGWDANAGLDVNFHDRWSVEFGARWLHSYGVPQQLGAGAVTIEPGYLQFKLGLGVGTRPVD